MSYEGNEGRDNFERYLSGIRQAYDLYELAEAEDKKRKLESDLEQLVKNLVLGDTPTGNFARRFGIDVSSVKQRLIETGEIEKLKEANASGEFDPKTVSGLMKDCGISREHLAEYIGVSKSLVDKWFATGNGAKKFFPRPHIKSQRIYLEALSEIYGYDPFNTEGEEITPNLRKKAY